MPPTQYSPKVDRHIYGISGGCESVDDWIELAVAALDQGGFSQTTQRIVRAQLWEFASSERLNQCYLIPRAKESARKAKE